MDDNVEFDIEWSLFDFTIFVWFDSVRCLVLSYFSLTELFGEKRWWKQANSVCEVSSTMISGKDGAVVRVGDSSSESDLLRLCSLFFLSDELLLLVDTRGESALHDFFDDDQLEVRSVCFEVS